MNEGIYDEHGGSQYAIVRNYRRRDGRPVRRHYRVVARTPVDGVVMTKLSEETFDDIRAARRKQRQLGNEGLLAEIRLVREPAID